MARMLLTALVATAIFFGAGQRALASDQEAQNIDCRASAGPCVKTAEGLTVTFDISPKPVKEMRDLTFTVTLSDKGRPVADASVMIDFTMPGMYMGTNAVRLKHTGKGIYTGQGVIVKCPTGIKIWQAALALRRAVKTSVVRFTFEVS
jgi:hypothetical protein